MIKGRSRHGRACTAWVLVIVSALVNLNFVQAKFRLSNELSDACGSDSRTHCADLDFRSGYPMWECLLDSNSRGMLGEACESKLYDEELLLARKGEYFDLTLCQTSVNSFCPGKLKAAAKVQCLVKNEKRITEQACRQKVFQYVQRISETVAFDPWVEQSCEKEIGSFCGNVSDIDGQMHQCLMENLAQLSFMCKDVEFLLKVRAEEDVRLNPIVSRACSTELASICSRAKATGGEALNCLQENRLHSDMTKSCAAAILRDEATALASIEMMPMLKRKCLSELKTVCKNVAEADAISCLKEHAAVASAQCRHSLFPVIKAQSGNIALDVKSSFVCSADLAQLCSDVESASGDNFGEAQACLDRHYDRLSADCKAIRKKEIALRHAAPELEARVQLHCGAEIVSVCDSSVDTFTEATLECLVQHLYDSEVSQLCQRAVLDVQRESRSDIAFAPDVAIACKSVIQLKCGGKQQLRCLQDLFERRDQTLVADLNCHSKLAKLAHDSARDINVDVGAAADCKDDINHFCVGVKYGRGRIHQCLRENLESLKPACLKAEFSQIRSEGGDASLMPSLRHRCAKDLAELCSTKHNGQSDLSCLLSSKSKLDQDCASAMLAAQKVASTDIRLNTDLFEACFDHIPTLCGETLAFSIIEYEFNEAADKHDHEVTKGGIVDCLVQNRHKIPGGAALCSANIVEVIQSRYENIDLDPTLSAACHDDRVVWCMDADTSQPGAVQSCLSAHFDSLSHDCREAEFEALQVQSEEFQLDIPLQNQCSGEISQHCRDVKSAGGDVLSCLEKALIQQQLSGSCKAIVHQRMAMNMKYASLNHALVVQCSHDAKTIGCGDFSSRDNSVFLCLVNALDRIQSKSCKSVLELQIEAQESDLSLSDTADQACQGDIQTYCSDVDATPGKLQQCLRANYRDLSHNCFVEEFSAMARAVMTHNIRAHPMIAKACKSDMSRNCQLYDAHEMMICLVSAPSSSLTDVCQMEIAAFQTLSAKFDVLDAELQRKCGPQMPSLCPAVAKVSPLDRDEGAMIDCLVSKYQSMDDSTCKGEIYQRIRSRAQVAHLDPVLEEACATDINVFCDGVVDTDGKVHECLREHLPEVSVECRVAEQSQMQVEAGDLYLKAHLHKMCMADFTTYCANERADPRLGLDCLQKHRFNSEFSPQCLEAVTKDLIRSSTDSRFLPFLNHECREDSANLCAREVEKDAQAADWGQSSNNVLYCLSERSHLQIKNPACKAQVTDFVVQQALDVRLSPAVISLCTEDMQQWCATTDPGRGHMRECLNANFNDLTLVCQRAMFLNTLKVKAVGESEIVDYVALQTLCQHEISVFCATEHGDHLGTQLCLERALQKQSVSNTGGTLLRPQCSRHILSRMTIEQLDMRLPAEMLQHCAADVLELCPTAYKQNSSSISSSLVPAAMFWDLGSKPRLDINHCLLHRVSDIKNDECFVDVYRQAVKQLQFPSTIPSFTSSCGSDAAQLCGSDDELKVFNLSCTTRLQSAAASAKGVRGGRKTSSLNPGCAKFVSEQLEPRGNVIDLISSSKSHPSFAHRATLVLESAGPGAHGGMWSGGFSGGALHKLLAGHSAKLQEKDSSRSFLVLTGTFASVSLAAFLAVVALVLYIAVYCVRRWQSSISVSKFG